MHEAKNFVRYVQEDDYKAHVYMYVLDETSQVALKAGDLPLSPCLIIT